MEQQVASAIDIAWNASSDQNLKRQAIEYLNQLRDSPTGWQVCLAIFVKDPRYSEIIRYVSLEVVNNAIQSGSASTNDLAVLVESLMQYVRQTYGAEAREGHIDSGSIQNKISQTITYLFSALYGSGWTSFFDDMLGLTIKGQSDGTRDNPYGVILYLRILISIHDEIGDIMLSRSAEEQTKANNLKDLIRERDVQKIALSWQEILSQWRTGNDAIVEFCLKAVGNYVSWIDISLVVNQAMLDLLYQQLSRAQATELPDGQTKVRDATIDVFTEIVAKKMKGSDKMQLISFLNLENVVNQLAASTPLQERRFTSRYDTDLAETVAKLVNMTTSDIVKVLETDSSDAQVKQQGETHLQAFLPLLLRFFSDEYDEICMTVIPSVTDLVSFLRKIVRTGGQFPAQYTTMLMPLLKSIIAKMKYDETSSWGDEEDQTDEAEFQDLRKRLASLQQSLAEIDEPLYIDVVTEVVGTTFESLQRQGTQVDWRDLDLALHEMFLFGELALRQGGLYKKDKPNSPAAERLVEMMSRLVASDIRAFSHPATQLQYMEICVRYCSYFERHSDHIPSTLENFLQLAHHPSTKVKTRAWYLFQRFVRHLRSSLGGVAQNIIEALSDLLTIQAEVPQEGSDGDEMSSEDHDQSADAIFNSQLYLFEAIGCASGTSSVPVDKQVLFAQTTMDPLFADMERNLRTAESGDEKATLQIHHDIMALGTLARGYSDWVPGSSSSLTSAPPAEVSEAFLRVAEATLVSLESLKTSFNIRTAARFAFSRLVGVLGSRILPQLPRWIDGLLTQTSSKDEMALFLRLLDQVIFGFKTEIYSFLDSLLTPFLQRVFAGMSEPTSGTDDEIQLAELKREYLNFLLVVLNNDLASVLVSTTNQAVFETVISTLEHFAKDGNDFPTAKMTFQVLGKMVTVWGGPDVALPHLQGLANGAPHTNEAPQPVLLGFDQFVMTKFSPLVWAIPTTPSFNPRDAQSKMVLGEMATLHKTIYSKLGSVHIEWVREKELGAGGLGLNGKYVEEYLESLVKMELKTFKVFFQVTIPFWLCNVVVS